MIKEHTILPLTLFLLSATTVFGQELVFSCKPQNDAYRIVTAAGLRTLRADTPEQAVDMATNGAGVLLLAEGYPETPTKLSPELFQKAGGKQLRLYVEYPSFVPGLEFGKPYTPRWERTVVTSCAFGDALPRMRILQIHSCRVLPVQVEETLLALAKVAGYNRAVYGLPKETFPVLFVHPDDENVLVSTTNLSRFATARYAPIKAWGPVWRTILTRLTPGRPIPELKWTPPVRPSFSKDEPLPSDAEEQCYRRAMQWYEGFLVHESWKDDIARPTGSINGIKPERKRDDDDSLPHGDGRFGILEGHVSKIRLDGSQPMRWLLRGDCNCESAMAFALAGNVLGNSDYSRIATNLADFVYFNSDLFDISEENAKHPWYGLLGWHCYGRGPQVYWGNDGAKAIIGTVVTGAILKTDRWEEAVVLSTLANLRTGGPYGCRDAGPIVRSQLEKHGWEFFARRSLITPWPQREGWMWACYLWLYDKTKYEPLLVQARTAITETMKRYPDDWGYALHEMQMERGRMILPLAWLVRVDDTPEHRKWLRRVVSDMRKRMDSSGAIQEELAAVPLKSNDEYGTCEVSIIHDNNDPCADVFYSMAPALVGIHEAYSATGEDQYAEMVDKMVEFFIRVQVRSEKHPRLDGGWTRAFDFHEWDYFGGDGDTGWGAWCSETGWLQSHVVAVLAARRMGTSLWDLTADNKVKAYLPKYRRLLELDKAVAIWKKALQTTISLANEPHRLHFGAGAGGLIDGTMGDARYNDGRWQGFRGDDLVATIKLDEPRKVGKVLVGFKQEVSQGVFLPAEVEVLVSADGKEFRSAATTKSEVSLREPGPLVKRFALTCDAAGRFVRVRAKNVRRIPEWHPAAGRPAWLFVDEISLED